MKALYGVYGVSGYGREVMPLAREQVTAAGFDIEQLVFVDDNVLSKRVNGHDVLTYDEFLRRDALSRHVAIAIADGTTRQKLTARLHADGVEAWQVVANNVVMMDEVELGDGAIISPFVSITSNAVIGRSFHANIYSYVAHDCVIGDFVTFAPGVKCNGNVVVEDFAYLGTGAILRQGKPGKPLTIGRGAVVGMGAVVTKNVAAGDTVIGNPARKLEK